MLNYIPFQSEPRPGIDRDAASLVDFAADHNLLENQPKNALSSEYTSSGTCSAG